MTGTTFKRSGVTKMPIAESDNMSEIITTKKEKHREHNHFPMGKTGYDPKTARMNDIATMTKKRKRAS